MGFRTSWFALSRCSGLTGAGPSFGMAVKIRRSCFPRGTALSHNTAAGKARGRTSRYPARRAVRYRVHDNAAAA